MNLRYYIIKYRFLLITIAVILCSLVLFAGTVKGKKEPTGKGIYYQKDAEHITSFGGPYEVSISTGRYVLTEAIVKNKSLILTTDLAKFASPDVSQYKGKFISIFTPGISFIGVPFYWIGEHFGAPQLFTYFAITLFAIGNIFIIAQLARKFGTGYIPGLLAGCIFVFATNGFDYALTFTQHQVSTTLVLLSLLTVMGKQSWKKTIAYGALFGAGLLVDFPNIFFMAPVGLFILAKSVSITKIRNNINASIRLSLVGIIIGLIPLLALFGWYNIKTTGTYTKLGQTIGKTHAFRQKLPPQLTSNTSTIHQAVSFDFNLDLPFSTRPQLDGLYILLISDERAWIYYSPVILLGLLGFYVIYKNEQLRSRGILALSVVLVDIVLYSMFGDPWGGWAFGARYLIPAAGVMAMLTAVVIERYKKNIVFMVIFAALLFYSVRVNTLGALTTVAVPPKVEAIHLQIPLPYTYKYSEQIIAHDTTSSLFYNYYLSRHLSTTAYLNSYLGIISLFFILLYASMFIPDIEEKKKT